MSVWTEPQRKLAQTLSEFAFSNPFDSENLATLIELAAQLLNELPAQKTIPRHENAKISSLVVGAESLLKVAVNGPENDADFRLYQDLVLMVLYYRYCESFQQTIERFVAPNDSDETTSGTVSYYEQFAADWRGYWKRVDRRPQYECSHVFASLFLIRRAYFHINEFIWGNSKAVQRLRMTIWQSIFSHDFRRFGLLLYNRMEDVTTLIGGPSGTGKELVARAIGLSRYIPFSPKTQMFQESVGDAFHPVNIMALSETLVESELFGHSKGAFTGATGTRAGWFEKCRPGHTVFLDEIGELSSSIQVKLLRVVQNREFQRLGETRIRGFGGKLIVATNRDFAEELAAGRFRADLYYRLCSDLIETPTLAEQLDGDMGELKRLVQRYLLSHFEDAETAKVVTHDVLGCVERDLGADYAWPGNFRELEQCIRNVVIRKTYRPLRQLTNDSSDSPVLRAIYAGKASADELLSVYCKILYEQTGSYAAASRILGRDQRTVKRYAQAESTDVDQKLKSDRI